MTNEQLNRLIESVQAHGDQLGRNLVHLKRFSERLQQEEQVFLAEQRAASDAAQSTAHRTAAFSAIAAGAAAIAALFQAYSAFEGRNLYAPNPAGGKEITAPPQPHIGAVPG